VAAKTAGLEKLFAGLNLGDKVASADAWCVEQGADDVFELAEEDNAEELESFVSHLGLPKLKQKKLLAAIKAGPPSAADSPPGGVPAKPEDGKFYARDLILGQADEAAGSLRDILGLTDEEFGARLALGEEGIAREFEEHGSEEDKANLHYVLHCKALDPHTMPTHLQQQVADCRYHGGMLQEGELDEGHAGMRLGDFVTHEKSMIANLDRCQTAALRLYTSSSFPCFNRPLREQKHPHPFAITVYHLAEGVRKMRKVSAKLQPSEWNKQVELWRGMADMKMDTEAFMQSGGSERALMSTSRSKGVAQQYAASQSPLIFKYMTRALQRGVDISFLSLYPKEKEFLYPPLTYLTPEKIYEEGGYTIVEVTPMMN
jgi:hypothetical protein